VAALEESRVDENASREINESDQMDESTDDSDDSESIEAN
jgi:hypothetical protein